MHVYSNGLHSSCPGFPFEDRNYLLAFNCSIFEPKSLLSKPQHKRDVFFIMRLHFMRPLAYVTPAVHMGVPIMLNIISYILLFFHLKRDNTSPDPQVASFEHENSLMAHVSSQHHSCFANTC